MISEMLKLQQEKGKKNKIEYATLSLHNLQENFYSTLLHRLSCLCLLQSSVNRISSVAIKLKQLQKTNPEDILDLLNVTETPIAETLESLCMNLFTHPSCHDRNKYQLKMLYFNTVVRIEHRIKQKWTLPTKSLWPDNRKQKKVLNYIVNKSINYMNCGKYSREKKIGRQ